MHISFLRSYNPFSNIDDVSSIPAEDLESFFHALRRLVASKAGFEAFTTLHR